MVRRFMVATCVVLLAASGVALAATTGRMAGNILDNEGLALPGVTVTISSDSLIGGPQVAISGADGGFVFNLLPVGAYRVEANLPGFQPASAEVRVSLDRAASVTFSLVPESFGGEIEVVAAVPVVDTAQVNTSQTFDQDYLQQAAIGSGGRDYLSIISQAAGVAGSGNASVYGGTQGDNSYLIDGLNTTDPLLGTFGTNFNYDAIQEISFQTGGFEAEFGQATGGIINLVTKSGGNEFSGSLDVRYANESFTENGEYFNRDDQSSGLRNISGTLGGPILRDKVWFFLSAENVLSKAQATGAPVVRKYTGWNYIAKGTWQVNDSHRMVFKYSGDPAEIPGANSSTFMTADASRTQEQGGDIFQIELNSVLSESILLNAQVGASYGYIESYSTHGDDTISLHTNEDSLIDYAATAYSSADDRDREEFRVNMTMFVDDLVGSHEFKAGLEYNDLFYGGTGYPNGGGYFYDVTEPDNPVRPYQDLEGDGFYGHYVTIQEVRQDSVVDGTWNFDEVRDQYTESNGDITTAFLQDSWRPMANLTVKPGIRVDQVQMSNSVGDDVSDMTRWQPRFGVAWDIMGDAKHVVRASWGQFMDATALSIPNFASGVTTINHEFNTLEFYCNALGICNPATLEAIFGESSQWTNAQGYTYTLFDNRGTSVYEPAQTLDQLGVGSLDAPYAEEMVIAYETQIASETSIELTYVDKKTKRIIEDTCKNNTWAWGDGDQPTFDNPDSWTTAAGCTGYAIVNMPDFYRDYVGAIAKFETRQENYHLLASYTWSESKGNTANGARESYATALADYFPVHIYNQDGYMPDNREHRVKLSGYILLPWDLTLGLDSFYSSAGRLTVNSTCSAFTSATADEIIAAGGDPEATAYCYTGDGVLLGSTDIFITERGAYETKSVWQADLQLSKSFTVGSVDLTGVISIYNLFDREMDATFNSVAFRTIECQSFPGGYPSPDCNADGVVDEDDPTTQVELPVGQPTSWYDPRSYEIGFRIEF